MLKQYKTKIPRHMQLMNRYLFSAEWRNLVLLCKAHFVGAQYTLLSFKLFYCISAGENECCIPKIFSSIKLTDYNWSFVKWACLIICLITTEKEMEIKDFRAGSSKQIRSKVTLYEMLILRQVILKKDWCDIKYYTYNKLLNCYSTTC